MRTRNIPIAAFALAILFVLSAPHPAQGSTSVSVSFFHDQLSPHGRWVVAGSYGDVWVPGGVAAGWAPYVDGQWVWTDYGWTWVSYDPWGDIPYHYGTWSYVSDYGWCWVPGTVWAPAWVTWAYSDNYIGWAPVPATFVFSSGGYFGGPVVLSASRYCFVPTSQFVGVNVSTVRVPVAQNTAIFANTTRATRFQVSNGVVHTAGLDPARVERVTGHQLQRASINQVHAQPTTVAAAGLSKSRSLGVVVPAKTRSQELRTTSTSHATEKHAPAATSKETQTHTAAKASPRSTTTENTHVAQKSKPQPKAKPEHSTTSAQSTSRSTHQKPVTEEKSRVAAKPQPKAPAEQHAKTSSTTAQKHVTTSSPRTAEVQHEKTPQPNVSEQSHSAQVRTEQRAATNHVQSSKAAPPKEHAAPQRVASNQPNQHAAPPPPKVKNPPPPPKERPKEEKPKGSESE
ncbi:MAG TPA: DUF6600 domain-containing protein [Thermoanaerobaculia bacterium]